MKYYLIYFLSYLTIRYKTDATIEQAKFMAEQIAHFKTKK